MFPNATYVNYPDFAAAYQATIDGECDISVLPLENSYAGDVGIVLDLVFSGSLYINQILELEVVHNIVSKKGSNLKDIKTVVSHPQALAKTLNIIGSHGFNMRSLRSRPMKELI